MYSILASFGHSSTSRSQFFSALRGTFTHLASLKMVAAPEYTGYPGEGAMMVSPAFTNAWAMLKIPSLDPMVMHTWVSGSMSRPNLFLYQAATALLRSFSPWEEEYFWFSLTPACLHISSTMQSGVGRSGSPMPKSIMSHPAALFSAESFSSLTKRYGGICFSLSACSKVVIISPPSRPRRPAPPAPP